MMPFTVLCTLTRSRVIGLHLIFVDHSKPFHLTSKCLLSVPQTASLDLLDIHLSSCYVGITLSSRLIHRLTSLPSNTITPKRIRRLPSLTRRCVGIQNSRFNHLPTRLLTTWSPLHSTSSTTMIITLMGSRTLNFRSTCHSQSLVRCAKKQLTPSDTWNNTPLGTMNVSLKEWCK